MLHFAIISFLLLTSLITASSSFASPTAETSPLFVNPYYPDFNQANDDIAISLIDASLENEIQQYNTRRTQLETLMIEKTDNYAGLLQNNSFVMRRMMDRGSRRILKSQWLKKSSVGRLTEDMKNHLEADIEYRDSKNIEHKFDFKIAAFQGQAFIQYSGVTKAQLRYDLSNGGSLAMIFQHSLSTLSSIGIETTLVGENRTQAVLLNIVW